MRSKNSTMMIGRVKLKSKRAAFSISAAKEEGEKVKEVTARRERDLILEEEERERGILGIFC